MRAPGFWSRPPGLLSRLLGPAELAYGAIAARRMRQPGRRLDLPVVCVGNFTLGGAGKTPLTIALAQLLRKAGRRPALLIRGYGGRLPGPVVVDPERHGAEEVGDEALLLAQHGPTIVARDRVAGAELAILSGADLIVMDDGLQNPTLTKSLSLAVFDGEAGIGNGRVFPAGPLRAPLSAQWPLIDAAVVMGEGVPGGAIVEKARGRSIPVFRARLRPRREAVADLAGARVHAFAGIGRPAKFFSTCRVCGLDVVEQTEFPDHHPFTPKQVARLLDRAEASGSVLITTEKDLMRLRALTAAEPRLDRIRTLPVEVELAAAAPFAKFILERLGAAQPRFAGGRSPRRNSTACGDS